MTIKNKNISKEKISSAGKEELQIIAFDSVKKWESWLAKNHTMTKGIWLKIYKKNSGIASITRNEALNEALCYGWIDGQAKKYDEDSYLQKFTPRRSRSIWSKINIEHVTRLEKEGKMQPSGWKAVEAAKADGRWERAYDPPSTMEIPGDFLKELSKNKKAGVFFNTLNKTNTYAIAWRLQTAKKPETRKKRIKTIIEMLARGEKFH